jgi:hypothetical protein
VLFPLSLFAEKEWISIARMKEMSLVLLLFLLSPASAEVQSMEVQPWPEPVEEFMFEVRNYNSTRMLGVCLNFIVRYRYPQPTTKASYINYLDLRDVVLRFAEPSDELPAMTFCESL